jgi:hypothetical protein
VLLIYIAKSTGFIGLSFCNYRRVDPFDARAVYRARCLPIFSGGIARDQVGGGLFRSRAATINLVTAARGLEQTLRGHL